MERRKDLIQTNILQSQKAEMECITLIIYQMITKLMNCYQNGNLVWDW